MFDGICNLCNASVQFIIRRDPAGKFKFTSLQSEAGQEMMHKYALKPDSLYSIILIQNGRAFERSEAVLRIAKGLTKPWPVLFYIFRIVPSFIRDAFYNMISKNRYRLFGKRDACMIPTSDLQSRFL